MKTKFLDILLIFGIYLDTTTILTTTTNTDTTTGPPQWPVGDCPCGIGVQDIETAISSETTPALPPDFERFRDYINSQYPTGRVGHEFCSSRFFD